MNLYLIAAYIVCLIAGTMYAVIGRETVPDWRDLYNVESAISCAVNDFPTKSIDCKKLISQGRAVENH